MYEYFCSFKAQHVVVIHVRYAYNIEYTLVYEFIGDHLKVPPSYLNAIMRPIYIKKKIKIKIKLMLVPKTDMLI